jgi:hypothetical protein
MPIIGNQTEGILEENNDGQARAAADAAQTTADQALADAAAAQASADAAQATADSKIGEFQNSQGTFSGTLPGVFSTIISLGVPPGFNGVAIGIAHGQWTNVNVPELKLVDENGAQISQTVQNNSTATTAGGFCLFGVTATNIIALQGRGTLGAGAGPVNVQLNIIAGV